MENNPEKESLRNRLLMCSQALWLLHLLPPLLCALLALLAFIESFPAASLSAHTTQKKHSQRIRDARSHGQTETQRQAQAQDQKPRSTRRVVCAFWIVVVVADNDPLLCVLWYHPAEQYRLKPNTTYQKGLCKTLFGPTS